ncbi:uncharacterized protein CTRU02_215254 [Colletotrichum truncatum]|uniref:Uncharacterized protein n=1 Tax=Colletotrichum truncatum TaxID=5467 RepID=A0ACC3YD91_COLTU|nr:uncharacterized protein CTRU02_12294 [Colletotrichum truncatum]KAF6784833.1 hypothetical protein CTRU02_12294 [Colletotrichum truncatum]
MKWEVQAFPDGPTLTLGGTVEQIYKRLVEINPNFDADWGVGDPKVADDAAALKRRTDFTGSSFLCGGKWPRTGVGDASKGIDYLYTVPEKSRNGAGPGNCGKVSCSGSEGQGASIYWCNDDTQPKELASFGSIADGALFLYRSCKTSGLFPMVSGQVFHKTNCNVIIANSYC